MKILHAGDWHIGKVVNDFSMLEDQEYILQQLFDIIKLEKPDAIIISGDVYYRSIPAKEEVDLLDDTLTTIIEKYQVPTFIIAGNHDSQERLSFASKLLSHKGLFIEGTLTGETRKITLKDDYGVVNFYLVPYSHPAVISSVYNIETINNYQEAFTVILNKLKSKLNTNERNIFVTHNYIVSNVDEIIASDSERSLSIGGADYIDVSLVEDFDYVALGHLHQGQKVKKENIRYSGSLLKYSFSEVNHRKSVVIVDLNEKGNCTYALHDLKPKRDMRIIEGELKTLLRPEFYHKFNRLDYILAKLTDTEDLYDPLNRLRAVYPNIMQIERNNIITNVESVTKAKGDYQNKSKLQLFSEFYQNIIGKKMSDKGERLLKDVLDETKLGDIL